MLKHESGKDPKRPHLVLAKGTMVSHYRVVEKIGAGGMGEVFLAEDTKLKRQVALKFLSVEQMCDNSVLEQFNQEAQAAARLQHPNIITIHEVNEYEGVPYISMDHINGQTLSEISENKSLSISEIVELGIQITCGLTVAHEQGITHRDLKPGNLMVDSTGLVKILDFGLAVLSNVDSINDPDSTVTSKPFANKFAGTISYMAPEQLIGQEISVRVDIFAFGVIMYELITAERPFKGFSISEISASILRDTPHDLNLKNTNVPYDLNRIISRCLAKKPDKRFQTARDVSNELEELLIALKQDSALSVTEQGAVKVGTSLSEEALVITTDIIRQLSCKDPAMIGSSLAYIDNGVKSDKLIFCLHGLGHDHRQFSGVLKQLPYRAVSLSLFGFDLKAQLRIPLGLHDHTILIHNLFKEVCDRLRPSQIIMVGSSSGADNLLHYASSEEFSEIQITGLLSLGCNIHLNDCFASGKFAELTNGDDTQILATINKFSDGISSLEEWQLMYGYFLTAFGKFGNQTEPLRRYASDIIAPFKDGVLTQFPKWYKSCLKRVPYVKFVTDTDGYQALDLILQEHIENNVLGDAFDESTIVKVPYSHMELGETEVALKQTLEFMKLLDTN